jgi:hypothetical protein
VPTLELFEPMGKPLNRRGVLSLRSIPRNIIKWLDTTFSITNYITGDSSSSNSNSMSSNDSSHSWLSVGNSAITNQQQINSYDCGVACLLYAEKCALMQAKEEINTCTTQDDISNYRRILQIFHKNISHDNF